MTLNTWILVGVIIVAIIGYFVNGKKKRWYRIYLVNGDMFVVYRQMLDWWWRDSNGMLGFRLPDGKSIKVSKHGVVKIIEDTQPK